MKRSGLLIATMATVLSAVCAVKAAGWFDGRAPHRPEVDSFKALSVRLSLQGPPRHWRHTVLQSH